MNGDGPTHTEHSPLAHPAPASAHARHLLALIVLSLVAAGVLAARAASSAEAQQALPGTWTTTLPRTGDPRQEVSFTEAAGKLYLFGGTIEERQQVFDPAANAWSPTPGPGSIEGKLDHVHGVAVGGRIYYIGGLTSWPSPDVGTVRIYDPATGGWSLGADMEARRRGAGGVAVHDGKIYYAGGIHDGRAVNWLDRYDPATNEWTALPPMPTARDHFSAAVLDGKLWAIGGRAGPNAIDRPTGVSEAYDFARNTWSSGHKPLPMPRGGFAAATIGCEVIIIGGEGGGPFGGAFAAVHAYNPASDSWRELASMPTPRHGIQAAVLRDEIYIAAGGRQQGGGATTDAFEKLTVGPQPACPAPPAPVTPTTTTPAPGPGTVPACCTGSAPQPPGPVQPPAPPAPGPEVVPPADRTAPRLRGVTLSRQRFHSVSSGARYGTALRLTVSEPGRLQLTVRRRSGTRLVRVPGSVAARVRSGRNTVRFTGRIAGKRLSAGRYVLSVVAVDAANNRSPVVRRSFSILPRPRART